MNVASEEGETWALRQLELAHLFARCEINAVDFSRDVLAARHEELRAGATDNFALGRFLDDVLYAIDDHNEFDDLRVPGELDDEQLREVVGRHLACWSDGKYESDSS